MREIKENSKTNCPKCRKKKHIKYVGLCSLCEYPEDTLKLNDQKKEVGL
jgi:hypothetical protein